MRCYWPAQWASIVLLAGVCRRLSSSVTLTGGWAGRPPGGRAVRRPTIHGGPVVLRPVRATPCFIFLCRAITALLGHYFASVRKHAIVDVKAATPDWPQCQNCDLVLGLVTFVSALASSIWPRTSMFLNVINLSLTAMLHDVVLLYSMTTSDDWRLI